MIAEQREQFLEFLAAYKISEAMFERLHPAVQRAWFYNYDAIKYSVDVALFKILTGAK